jgi:hypothetical protein
MAFDWKEYLGLARWVCRQPAGGEFSLDASARCAVSRAYYGAFCHARNYARDTLSFFPTQLPDDHRLLREHLKNRRHTGVASRLGDLSQWRNQCDYEDTVEHLDGLLDSALAQAEIVIKTCKTA